MKKLVGILLAVLAVGGTALAAGAIVEKELDYEKGKLVYEVEAEQDGYEYEYEVDATTGEVLEKEKERDYDDGRLEYQIEFRVGNKEYEYEVDAKTGNIHERDFDVEDDRWDD